MSDKEYKKINTKSLVKLIIEIINNKNTESDILTIEEFNLYINNKINDKKIKDNITEKIKEIVFHFDDLHFTNGRINNSRYHRILSKLKKIKFGNCNFECGWKHIDCPDVVYTDCTFNSYIHSKISEGHKIVEKLLFCNCNLKKIKCEGLHFKSKIFKFFNTLENKGKDYFNEIIFNRCVFDEKVWFPNVEYLDNFDTFKIGELKLKECVFKKKVEIKNLILEDINLENTKFSSLCDFYMTEFVKTNFVKTDFNDISVFTESTFRDDVNFKYTTFNKLAIFRKTVFKQKLNLIDSIFNTLPNLLGITSVKNEDNDIILSNRETARIIKDSFEKQNNIIEANKFYALEMKEREKELSQDIKERKNLFEWLVFKIHGLSSNHSTDALLSLLWIIIISFVVGLFNQKYYFEYDKYMFIITTLLVPLIIGLKSDKVKVKIELSIFTVLIYLLTSINLDFVANLINPFSIMIGKDELTFGTLIYKIIIAYLIYQLIISIRQNTRRK